MKNTTALEGHMKAAAARRARGRQAESTKKGGGERERERERVVERHRVSIPVNCIGRLHASSKYLPV